VSVASSSNSSSRVAGRSSESSSGSNGGGVRVHQMQKVRRLSSQVSGSRRMALFDQEEEWLGRGDDPIREGADTSYSNGSSWAQDRRPADLHVAQPNVPVSSQGSSSLNSSRRGDEVEREGAHKCNGSSSESSSRSCVDVNSDSAGLPFCQQSAELQEWCVREALRAGSKTICSWCSLNVCPALMSS
jgi:hypothetical protein